MVEKVILHYVEMALALGLISSQIKMRFGKLFGKRDGNILLLVCEKKLKAKTS
jgi:hypothetical protein